VSPRGTFPVTAVEVDVVAPCDWVSANDRGGHYAKARKVALWRKTAGLMFRQALGSRPGFAGPVLVAIEVHRTSNRRSDSMNLADTVKPCIDAAVDAGLLADDDDAHITEYRIRRGPNREHRALTIRITQEDKR
jgi:Holliday junction resolvase RusA-like endonuclease